MSAVPFSGVGVRARFLAVVGSRRRRVQDEEFVEHGTGVRCRQILSGRFLERSRWIFARRVTFRRSALLVFVQTTFSCVTGTAHYFHQFHWRLPDIVLYKINDLLGSKNKFPRHTHVYVDLGKPEQPLNLLEFSQLASLQSGRLRMADLIATSWFVVALLHWPSFLGSKYFFFFTKLVLLGYETRYHFLIHKICLESLHSVYLFPC